MGIGTKRRWLAALLLVALASFSGCSKWQELRFGIRPETIRLTAGGYMLDFRYQVVDAGKARELLLQQHKPVLVDEASGARFAVPEPPKVGALRTSGKSGGLAEGKSGFVIFANPGHYVKRGNLVTVEMGAFRAKHLRVE